MKNSIRILHLSDIHYDNGNVAEYEKSVINPLLADLKVINDGYNIDLICITGDLINRGNAGFENSDDAYSAFNQRVLSPVIDGLKINNDMVFFVPGNHDVQREKDSKYIESGLKGTLNESDSVTDFIKLHTNDNYEGIERCRSFKNFERCFYIDSKLDKIQTPFQSSYIRNVSGLNIGIVCLNSSWRSYDNNDDGNLIIGMPQLSDSLIHLKDCDFRILLSHHYTDSLCKFEQQSIDEKITESFNIALLGHRHSPQTWCKSILRGTLFTTVGRGNWFGNVDSSDSEYINGYSIIDYDIDNYTITQTPRIYSKKRNEYVSDTLIAGDSGVLIHKISDTCTNISTLHNICRNICNSFIQQIDQDLIIYGTDTNAPSTISGIFVQPNLVGKQEEDPDKDENLLIDDIASNWKNYAIIGVKETGKTILLDRLVQYYLEKINELKIIPVHIKYEEYHHARFETAISIFSGVPIKDVGDFLNDNKVVLLIDNLKFDKNDSFKTEQLLQLLNKYKKLRIIVTMLTESEGTIPLDFVSSKIYELCKVVHIKYFRYKQISELTTKWHSNSNVVKEYDEIDKIVNLLMSLQLPRTPLSISMFLWILEKQEEYQPINQAIMLENFIEKMFKKHSKEEEFFRDFDYRNKEKLISAIALEMFNSDRPDYSLKLSYVFDLASLHLRKRKFDFDSELIIRQLIDIGLLVKYVEESEPYLRFRFNCFFQYFLMKNMESKEFLEYALKEENYLSFRDEISLFTGIKRDRTDILKICIDRMNELFKPLLNDINKLDNSFDSFFEVQISYAEQMNRGFIDSVIDKKTDNKKQIEDLKDQMLETTKPCDTVQRKNFTLSLFQQLERSWTLVSNILRNTEETDEDNLKYQSFVSILKSSIAFTCLYKYLFVENLRKKGDELTNEERDDSKFMLQFLPVLQQYWLTDVLVTPKLNLVFKEHIDKILNDKTISQIEKFTTVFLYADGNGKNYIEEIKHMIGKLKGRYIYDMYLFKLVSFYYLRSKTKSTDIEYENMIADLIVMANNYSPHNKSSIMQSYRKKRVKYVSTKQANLEF